MNVFILCIFALVPFHNASVHEAKLTVCPDFAEVLRFENKLESYQAPEPVNPGMESVLKPATVPEADPAPAITPESDPAPAIAPESALMPESDPAPALDSEPILIPETVPEPIHLGQLEPEIVPENSNQLKQPVAELATPAEPAPLEIPERLTPKPISPSRNVEFAAAEEPISEVQPVPAGVKVQETAPTDVPIRRPWGVLTFSIFLLLLSVSANVFLGWQLIEARLAKLR